MLASIFKAGISVKNESSIPILVIISQLTPLYWSQKLMPGETFNEDNKLGLGKVWFTVSVSMFDERNVPTVAGTAFSLLAITATAVLPVAVPIFVGTAVVSGLMASRGVSKTGVYSDGSTLYVRGTPADGAYVLHFADEGERRNLPYAGPPPPEALAAIDRVLSHAPPAPAPPAPAPPPPPAPATATAAGGGSGAVFVV